MKLTTPRLNSIRALAIAVCALALGACGGGRTGTASVAMVGDVAKSNVPMLGYTVPYAVSNTLLTLWGLVIVLIY